jgi:hypothetical protein
MGVVLPGAAQEDVRLAVDMKRSHLKGADFWSTQPDSKSGSDPCIGGANAVAPCRAGGRGPGRAGGDTRRVTSGAEGRRARERGAMQSPHPYLA